MGPRTPQRRGWTPRTLRLAGLAMVAAASALVAIGFIRPDPFAGGTEVHVLFDDVRGTARAGLKTTTEVRLAGAKVGDVEKIERRGADALLTLKIDDAAAGDLRRDAGAEMRPRTPFEGNAYIDLTAGSASEPRLKGKIRPPRARNYVSLYESLSFARRPTRERLSRLTADLSDALGAGVAAGLQRSLHTLPRLTRDLGPAMRAFGGPGGRELGGAVRGAARTFAAVAASERAIVPSLRDTAKAFAALDPRGGAPLDAALRVLPGTLESMRMGGPALRRTLERLDVFAADLNPSLERLPAALRAARPLLRELAPALSRSVPVVRDLRAALSSGGEAAAPARRLLAASRPATSILNGSLLAALEQRVATGSPAYLALLNTLQGAAGAFASLQTEAQGKLPGSMGAGHLVNFEGRFYTGYATPDPAPCSLIEAVSPALAKNILDLGACKP